MKIRFLLLAAMLCLSLLSVAQSATEHWRPVYHFTAPKNWLNDPNGPIFLDGRYHLYYQHNPFGNAWGHMSWGHATSTDLITWKHLPVAITERVGPDTTTWIFSGSVVLDKQNTSGFGRSGKPPLVAIYTADQPKQQKETQALAYSNDGGQTFRQYPGNPVIDLGLKDFRDPNVFWHEQSRKWVMAVALPAVKKIQFYTSGNLKDWRLSGEFGPAGYTKHHWECPFLVPLPVEGRPGVVKWLMMVSSGGERGPAFMQYFVGDFDGETFRSDYEPGLVLPVDYGDTFYAAIPYRLGRKSTLIGWMMPGKTETFPWRGQMSLPRDLGLVSTPAGIRLTQRPAATAVAAVKNKYRRYSLHEKQLAVGKLRSLHTNGHLNSNCWWLDLEIDPGRFGKQGLRLAADAAGNEFIEVGYDPATQQLYVDAGAGSKDQKLERNRFHAATLATVNGKVRLQVLLDKSTLEVFANDGRAVITTLIYPTAGASGILLFSENSKTVIPELTLYDLDKR